MSPPQLISAYEGQDPVFARAFSVVRDAIAARAFPGASLAVTHRGYLVALKSFGSFTYPGEISGESFDVSPSTIFDVASLTKPIATATMAMILHERGHLEIDAPVAVTVPEIVAGSGAADPRRREITYRMLMAHSSGLPAYEKLFLKASSRDELLQAAFSIPLTADPGTLAEYSDIGFIILGLALERIANETLDAFCQREVFAPLAMTSTTFRPSAEMRQNIPPTADERVDGAVREPATPAHPPGQQKPRSTFRNRIIQGEVQDENAFVLGGVGGHAGLFSTAEDLARFSHAMLCGGDPILRSETIALFTGRESSPAGTSRTLGWDTPSAPSQSGKYFGASSYGHLGYTGTSLWIDPERELSITLLTNRTWPDCANTLIKQVRPRVHDAIIEALA